MKKILRDTLIVVSLSLASCSRFIDQVKNDKPTEPINKVTLETIGTFKLTGGTLYVYVVGADTIYWAEGASTSCPVALQIKK